MSRLPVPEVKPRKLSPPLARNELTVTEYAVAVPIALPLSHMLVTRSPSGRVGS